jgi:hypothetical protein
MLCPDCKCRWAYCPDSFDPEGEEDALDNPMTKALFDQDSPIKCPACAGETSGKYYAMEETDG